MVPVEEWTAIDEADKSERTVDVKALAGTVWSRRNFILKVTGAFLVIGVIIALLSPVGYRVEATLLPENQVAPAGNLLRQFGGLLGIGGAPLTQSENLPPQLYPNVVSSLPFQVELLSEEVTFARYDTTVTPYTYFSEIFTPSVLTTIKGYTIGLPGKIMGLFREDIPPQPLPSDVPKDSIISLTKYQLMMVEVMRKHVDAAVNEENGLVTLQVSMADPRAAAEIGAFAIDLLQEYVTDYRTEKAEQYLQFVREQTQQAREEFQDVQTRLAIFEDQNINLATQQSLMQLKRLESKYDLLFSKYHSLAQQLQQAKLKVQQKTPVLTVLQPIKMPVDNYKPQRKLIVILALFLGLVLSIGYIIGRSVIDERKMPE